MTVTFYELEGNNYERIGEVDDGEIVEGEDELVSIGVDQFVHDEEKLLRVYDGPYIIAGIGSSNDDVQKSNSEWGLRKSVESVFKEWVPYEGPQGGEGWQNTLTGEVRYQETKPSGAGSDADVTVPANSTLDTVTAAVTSVLGATVASALRDQLRGGSGGTFNPQMYVTAAAMYIVQTGRGSLFDLQDALNEEAEDEPEDSVDVSVEANGHDVSMTNQTGVSDVTGAISEVSGNETVARLSMQMSDEEEQDSEAWVQEYLHRVEDEETVDEFQDALDQRIRERKISTDMYRGGVVVPDDMNLAETKDAAREVLGDDTFEWMRGAVEANSSVDENDPESWVRATLTQIGDDSNARREFQNQFDVSAAEGDEEPKMVTMQGGGEEIEMPTGTTAEDARDAIGETFSDEALKLTARSIEERGADPDDPKQWVMTSLTLAQINNPEGFENHVDELQDSLVETDEAEDEDPENRSVELIDDFDPEGDWQSYVDPVTDLLEEGESAGDIVSALKEHGSVGDHSLEDNQVRQVAFRAHKEATERNAPIEETADNPTLSMDWGNEFPEAMRDRARERFGDQYEQVEQGFGMWSEDPHGEEMASMWNYVMNQTGNGNVPEGIEGNPEEEEVEALATMHQMNQDTLQEIYGESVPVFRPISGRAAQELKDAKESDEEGPIEFSHRPAESWSSDIEQIANRTEFEGDEPVVIRREVSTENVMASSLLGNPGMDTEDNGFVVMSDDRTEYQTDDVLTSEDLKDPEVVMEQVEWSTGTITDEEGEEEGDSE
jgi:hypothetical protein